MANSTKIAIVGLMILLVVVVARYVQTGAPVNEGSAGGVTALDPGTQAEAENPGQVPSRSGLASLSRKPVFSSSGGNFRPIQIARGADLSPEATAPETIANGQQGIDSAGTAPGVLPPESEALKEKIAQAQPSAENTAAPVTEPSPDPARINSANLPSAGPGQNPPGVAKTPNGFPKKHIVQVGEGYWVIAQMYYGKGHLHALISAANKKNGKVIKLHPGMKLTIPAPPPGTKIAVKAKESTDSPETKAPVASGVKTGSVPTPSSTPAVKPLAPKGTPGFYTVKSGDSLMQIAEDQLGSTRHVDKLKKANKHLDLDFLDLTVGTRLRLPGI